MSKARQRHGAFRAGRCSRSGRILAARFCEPDLVCAAVQVVEKYIAVRIDTVLAAGLVKAIQVSDMLVIAAVHINAPKRATIFCQG